MRCHLLQTPFRTWMFTIIGLLNYSAVSNASSGIKHSLQFHGETTEYELTESVSPHGERQVVIQHEERRPLVPDTSVTVLVGRDLDGDGRFDAWFFMGNDGAMESIDQKAQSDDGWDVAESILQNHTQLQNRWLIGILANYVGTHSTITMSYTHNLMETLAGKEVELLSLDVIAKRIAAIDPRAPELLPIYRTLSDGWAEIAAQTDLKQLILANLADDLFYLSGEVIAAKLLKMGPWISSTAVGGRVLDWTSEISERYLSGIKSRALAALERVKLLNPLGKKMTGDFAVDYAFLKLSVGERLSTLIEGLEARGKLGRLVAQTLITAGNYAETTVKRLPYIALTQTLQLASEIYDKRGVLYNRNPIIMGKRVMSDKDLVHDLSYMTVETAITSTIIDRNGNGRAGFMKAGAFSMVDSNAMSYWMNGDFDLKRTAIDTGWEVGVGNLQTVIDMRTLTYFEKISIRSENPKLKLVGYLCTGIDQFTGYVLYAKLTSSDKKDVAPDQKTEMKVVPITLTPIFAPQDED